MSKRAEEVAWKIFPPIDRSECASDEEYIDTLIERDSDRALFVTAYLTSEADAIERACDWLFSHLPILLDYYDEDIHEKADRSEFIKLFRTQMEDEQ